MSLQQEYMEDWLGYWTYVSQRAIGSWFKMARRVQSRQSGPDTLFTDIMDFWTGTAAASAAAWRGTDRRPPVVLFSVDAEDSCGGSRCVPVFAQRLAHKTPSIVWLGPLGGLRGSGAEMTVEALRTTLSDDETELELKLVGLTKFGGPLEPATYRALVHIDEFPVAEVFIVVAGGGPKAGSSAQA